MNDDVKNASTFNLPGLPQLLKVHDLLALLDPEHLLPPFFGRLAIFLVRCLTPRPQLLEHFDHRPQDDH